MDRTACTKPQCLYKGAHLDKERSSRKHSILCWNSYKTYLKEHTVLGIMLTCHFSIRCLQFPIWDSRLLDTHVGIANQSSSIRTSHIASASRNAILQTASTVHLNRLYQQPSVRNSSFLAWVTSWLFYVYCSLLKHFVFLLSHIFCCNILQSRSRDALGSLGKNRCLLKWNEAVSWLNGWARPGLLNFFLRTLV